MVWQKSWSSSGGNPGNYWNNYSGSGGPWGNAPQTQLFGPTKSQYQQQKGYNIGSQMSDLLKGFQSSPLGSYGGYGGSSQPPVKTSYGNQTYSPKGDPWWQKKMAAQNGSGYQQQQYNPGQYYLDSLQNSGPYAALQKQFGTSYNTWNIPIQGQIDQLYGGPMAAAKKISDSANPSGAPILSAGTLYAAGLQPIEQGAQALGQNLRTAGAAGGNRSGIGSLQSTLPSHMVAGQAGGVATQANIGAYESEMDRASLNAQTKQNALDTWGGMASSKAGLLSSNLLGYTSLQQSAMSSAMSAYMQVLGIMSQNQPQFNMQGGPGGTTWSYNAPLGYSG